jgi:hypothetical protein
VFNFVPLKEKSMAQAFRVKNKSIVFYSAPSAASDNVVSVIHRDREVEPHQLNGFSVGDYLGEATGKTQTGFIEIDYEFAIRVRGWTGVGYWANHVETVWVKTSDVTTDSTEKIKNDAVVEQEKKDEEETKKLDDIVNEDDTETSSPKTSQSKITALIVFVALIIIVVLIIFKKSKNA